MNLRQLQFFVAIVEEGSFTRAADRVHTVQPALTEHIKSLEREFGVSLLIRGSRGVRPTPAGERLVVHAKEIIEQFETLHEKVVGAPPRPAGEVRIAIPVTVSTLVSPRLIERVTAEYPEIRLRIVEPMAGVITDWLEETKVDFGISYRPSHARGVEAELILTERVDLCCGASSPLASVLPAEGSIEFSEAIRLPLIAQYRGYSIREMLESHAKELGSNLNVSIEIASNGPIKALLEQGCGYAFLPPMATVRERAQGIILSCPVDSPALERPVYLISLSDRPLSRAAAAVRTVCCDLLRELVTTGAWEARPARSRTAARRLC